MKNKPTRGEAQGSLPDIVAQTDQPALLTVKQSFNLDMFFCSSSIAIYRVQ
ncbi:hypothetical protein ACFLYR_01615 [Chloroflexota bacterium]